MSGTDKLINSVVEQKKTKRITVSKASVRNSFNFVIGDLKIKALPEVWCTATGDQTGTTFGTGTISGETIERVMNNNDTFIEYFMVRTLHDEANSDVTISAGDGELDFTNTDVFQSQIIAKQNGRTFRKAELNVDGTDTDNLTFNIQFDGSNWESITAGNLLTSAHPSSSGIKWKATATDTASLTKVTVKYYE